MDRRAWLMSWAVFLAVYGVFATFLFLCFWYGPLVIQWLALLIDRITP